VEGKKSVRNGVNIFGSENVYVCRPIHPAIRTATRYAKYGAGRWNAKQAKGQKEIQIRFIN
jgi:hypothetical protein